MNIYTLVKSFLIISVLLLGKQVMAEVHNGHPPPPMFNIDHYLMYDITTNFHNSDIANFQQKVVHLSDQFGEGFYVVHKPVELLPPTSKWVGSGETTEVIDTITHLVSYAITGRNVKVPEVVIDNQFGELGLTLSRKPQWLLVPALKGIGEPGNIPPGDPNEGNPDHYLCYQILEHSEFMFSEPVFATDQFSTHDLQIVRPTRLCNPVEKTVRKTRHQGLETFEIKHIEDHLVCYEVQTEFEPISPVFTLDQIANLEFSVDRLKEICLPSSKMLATE